MIEIIPAIDIIGGKCVRLSQGDYNTSHVYNESPLDVARQFVDAGCNRLHLVDLDGAKSHHIVNYNVLEKIASHTNLKIDFGGGIKSDEDVRIAMESGAEMVTGGSIAVTAPDIFENWLAKYGIERIILGADTKNGKIATNGWLESSDNDILPFIEHYVAKGVTQVISTDISKDGMLQGPAIELYTAILDKFPDLLLVASGGVSGMHDIEALDEARVPAAIVGKALYENKISMQELERHNTMRTNA